MAAIIRKLIEAYHYVNDDLADPRSVDYPMISNPFCIAVIIIIYNVFIQCIGPRIMKDRKPFNLKNIIIAYDFLQIVINFSLLYQIVKATYWTGKYSIFCEPVGTGTTPQDMMVITTVHYYFLTKILDLLDTVFFMLSKKSNHVSFLHVYHHSGMVLCGWVGVKYVPGGQAIFFGAVNGFVHGLMYTYYLLAALRYLDSRHIFWKRSLTQLQMGQFLIIGLNQLGGVIFPECGFPLFISSLIIPQLLFMFILFGDFYRKSYKKKQKSMK